jgi:hypothetical protein
MEFRDDPEAAQWLNRLRVPEEVEWDEGNREKMRKHAVAAEHVEAMLAGSMVLAGRVVVPEHSEPW